MSCRLSGLLHATGVQAAGRRYAAARVHTDSGAITCRSAPTGRTAARSSATARPSGKQAQDAPQQHHDQPMFGHDAPHQSRLSATSRRQATSVAGLRHPHCNGAPPIESTGIQGESPANTGWRMDSGSMTWQQVGRLTSDGEACAACRKGASLSNPRERCPSNGGTGPNVAGCCDRSDQPDQSDPTDLA